MTVLHSGTTKKYSDNWEAAFKGSKAASKATAGASKKAKTKKSSPKKKAAPKKAAKKTRG